MPVEFSALSWKIGKELLFPFKLEKVMWKMKGISVGSILSCECKAVLFYVGHFAGDEVL